MNNYEDILCHHGIKEMKWGIRRYQNADGSLTEAGKIRYGKARASLGRDKNFEDLTDKQRRKQLSYAAEALRSNDRALVRMYNAGKIGKKATDEQIRKAMAEDTTAPTRDKNALIAAYLGTVFGGPVGGISAGLLTSNTSGFRLGTEVIEGRNIINDYMKDPARYNTAFDQLPAMDKKYLMDGAALLRELGL